MLFGAVGQSNGYGEYGAGLHLEPQGSAYGAGFDWAITDHWILGAEYSRKRLSNRGTDSFGAINIFSGVDTELSVVQASLK